MKLVRNLSKDKNIKNCVVAIGNFDGVHPGHQHVIRRGIKLAKEKGKKFALLTFEPHPKTFFSKKKKFFRITPFRKKFELISSFGIDYYFNLKFDHNLSEMSASDFIDIILIKKFSVCTVITGNDFVFGKQRAGNIELLKFKAENSKLFDFVSVKDFSKSLGNKYSSSDVRKSLQDGKIEKVKELLGRNWSIFGRIIRGQKLARDLGFPTANINVSKYCKLKFGVYAVDIKVAKQPNKKFQGIANYGIKPTFNLRTPLLEVNIFDFDSDIYGENIEITFKYFIRNEKKFKKVRYLKDQILIDTKIAKKFFNNE